MENLVKKPMYGMALLIAAMVLGVFLGLVIQGQRQTQTSVQVQSGGQGGQNSSGRAPDIYRLWDSVHEDRDRQRKVLDSISDRLNKLEGHIAELKKNPCRRLEQ